jgi:hypothetical protein
MRKIQYLFLTALLALLTAGCGKSAGTGQAPAGNGDSAAVVTAEGPAVAIGEFLEALRTGNDEKATKMLSTAARQKTASLNRNVTPPASDTAKYTVGKVEYIGDDGARVSCTWTDLGEDGQPKTDDAVWVVRHEQEGWRVAGVAALVFPGEPPLLLNFEDPDDMFRKQQWVREEMRRRMEAGGLQAQGTEKQEKPIRR